LRFAPDLPAGLKSDDSSHTSAGYWRDGSNVRFRQGRPETIHGWESVIADPLTGVCRAVYPWTDNDGLLNLAFGTHSHLQVYQGGELFDITPTLARPSVTLTDPFTVVDASADVTVEHLGHGLATGDTIDISGASYVGRILPDGEYTVTRIDADNYTITHGSVADLAATLASGPLAVTNTLPTVTVTDTAHKIADGTTITVSGASAVGGITPNGSFVIANINANSYRYTFTSNATSDATGGGAAVVVTVPATGGGSVTITPQALFAAGQIDGTGSTGYGTGGYGIGGYGEPSETENFPRTWSLGAFGQNLIANPRLGTIYQWLNDTAVAAVPIANAPRQVTAMLIASQDQIFALGCNEEVSGEFNGLCIRHTSIRNASQWNTASNTTAREYILPGGGRIISGRVIGPHILVWTNSSLFLGQYVGSLSQPWRFDKVGDKCGLIGPNAAVVVGQTAYWISPDRQFHAYSLGGAAQNIPCPIRSDFADNLAASQGDKIHASSVGEYGEVWWYYPDDRDGLECSRYVALCVDGEDRGAWFRGQMARTASVDAGPSSYPCRTTAEGQIYWHERGGNADGGALLNHIETADLVLSEDSSMLINEMRPDFQDQQGVVTTTVTTRFEPQGSEFVKGPYTASPGQRKVDMRASGRYARLKHESSYRFRIGQSVYDVKKAGNR
jgi:hypothetical protein